MADDGKGTAKTDEVAAERYDEELLSANWNPVIALLEWSCARTASDAARSESRELGDEDADDFLGRIYTAGT